MKQQESHKAKQSKKEASEQMHGKTIAAYQTYPLSNAHTRQKETNIAIPSDDDVKEAKDWVDANHK